MVKAVDLARLDPDQLQEVMAPELVEQDPVQPANGCRVDRVSAGARTGRHRQLAAAQASHEWAVKESLGSVRRLPQELVRLAEEPAPPVEVLDRPAEEPERPARAARPELGKRIRRPVPGAPTRVALQSPQAHHPPVKAAAKSRPPGRCNRRLCRRDPARSLRRRGDRSVRATGSSPSSAMAQG